jgi:subtilisin family serine protease
MRARLTALLAVVAAVAVALAGCTGGPGRSDWAFTMVQVSALAAQGFDGQGVTVAIVDTGIDLSHPNLAGVVVAFWEDLVSARPDPYDDNGHGTAMASILVGRGSLAGGAPAVTLIVIKAVSADGSGSDAVVATAVNDAVAHGADVISLSLGGAGAKLIQRLGSASVNAVQSAAAQGVLVVASAGNDGESDDGQVASPSVARDAVSVGAVDASGVVASFSSIGRAVPLTGSPDQKPEVVAPGVNITVAWLDRSTATVSGTSPAAVFVAAALALLLEMKPSYQRAGSAGVDAVKAALMNSAKPGSGQTATHDAHYGYGIVQASAAAALLP